MKKPDLSNLKKHFKDIKKPEDLQGLSKKVPNKVYAGVTLASAAGIAVTALVPKLRILSPVFQAAAVGSAGLAKQNMDNDCQEAEAHYKALRTEVTEEILKGTLKTKAAKDLTDEDAVKLSMLTDLQLGQFPRSHQAEALKVQIAIEVHDANQKNRHFAPPLTFMKKKDQFLYTRKGIELLYNEREMVRTMRNGPTGSNALQTAANRFQRMRMLSRVMGNSSAGKKVAAKAKKGGQFMNKFLMVSQTKDVVLDSTKIFSYKPLPRFKDAAGYVEFNLARLHQAQDTVEKIKEGTIKPMGLENVFRLPK